MRSRVLTAVFLLAACASQVPAPQPARPEAATAAAVLWSALDGEALFTIAGGLKPMSGGFWQGWIAVEAPDLTELRQVRADLEPLRAQRLWADVHVFDQVHEGRRAAHAYVVDRDALMHLLEREAAFFAPYGLAPDTHPAEVVAVVERMPKLDRHRGQGLLFGYPEHAIDFFVAAEAEREPGAKPAPRRFVQIPTFGGATGRFVYAVPQDQEDLPADRELAAAAAQVLQRYRELRDSAEPRVEATLRVVRTLRREFDFTPAAASAAGGR